MYDKEREAPRVNRLFLTSYVNREGEEQKTPVSIGRTLDISATGAGMEVYQDLQVGSVMDLEFDLQNCLLTVQGKVVHSRRESDGHHVIGIRFDEFQERLAELIAGEKE
jgi:c-di-GMP-binding flagellar brake protein YcgR